ncbi:unnamed protein product [Protopolystoma xenopodis]|uniref:Uncharacterized protein n=1 Tax=Protopolystoma xenopodis TaxID=117903 RepID=A0A448WVW1_9PLAT|nr:unnamed protein product [Protopolystoma xenopodis]
MTRKFRVCESAGRTHDEHVGLAGDANSPSGGLATRTPMPLSDILSAAGRAE